MCEGFGLGIWLYIFLLIKSTLEGAGKKTQLVKFLPNKHADLSLDSQNPHTRLAVAIQA